MFRALGGVVGTAMSAQGAGYVYGGTAYGAWDCSGFTQWVFAQNGIDLPRTTWSQFAAGTPTDAPDEAAGPERAPHRSYYYAMGLDEEMIGHLMAEMGFVRSGDSWKWRGRRSPRKDQRAPAGNQFAALAELKRRR